MTIYVDDGYSKDQFFISVPVGDTGDAFSFDWTTKGQRILLQRWKEYREPPTDRNPDGEWDTLIIRDGELVGKEHTVWYDLGKEDLANGEIWEQIQAWPLNQQLAGRLLKYSNIIREHQNELGSFYREIKELEALILEQANQLGIQLI